MNTTKRKDTKVTTAHKRRIVLYLPTKEMIEKWNTEADKAGMTTSSFVQDIVCNYFDTGSVLKSREAQEMQCNELNQTIQQLRGENIELAKKVKMLDSLTDRQEEELKRLRNQSFLSNGAYNGIRNYEQKLIELLKTKKKVKEEEILELLHVDPSDNETKKALLKQLENLIDYGVIRMFQGGYQWLG